MTHTTRTLFGLLTDAVRADPERRTLIEPVEAGTARHHVEHTRLDLLATAVDLADLLRSRGIGDGDGIAVWLPSWAEVYAWQFAASAVGAHIIGVNTRYNVAEVGNVLTKARPAALVMAHGFRGIDFLPTAREAVAEAREALEDREALSSDPEYRAPAVVVSAGPGVDLVPPEVVDRYDLGAGAVRSPVPGTTGHTAAEVLARADAYRTEGSPSTLSVAFTTSGSTGLPKVAAHCEHAVLHHMSAVAERLGFGSGDVMVEPLPYSGVFGYMAGMAALAGGASVLLHPVFDPEALLDDWERFGGTHYVGGDDMIARVRAAWEGRRRDLSIWRWWGVADFQGMSAELAAWSAGEFGTVTSGVYGSSEVFSLLTFWEDSVPPAQRVRGGGRLSAPDYAYRIVDPHTGTEVPEGHRGEIQLWGPNVVDEYLGDRRTPDGTPASGSAMDTNTTEDGWFLTGDLGEAVDDRSFVYVCRMGDVIRLKGFLVDPAEIEVHLAEHPAVEIVKVVSRTDGAGEPEVVAFVQPAPGSTPDGDELRDFCARRLARYKVPAEVRVIERMPTTAGTNGSKIKAAVLRDWARN